MHRILFVKGPYGVQMRMNVNKKYIQTIKERVNGIQAQHECNVL
jgi:hypothetical protein